MFGMIDQVLEVYKAELRAYKKWLDETSARYGANANNPLAWDRHDYAKVTEWNAVMKGMEKALGLDKKEVERIGKSVGL